MQLDRTEIVVRQRGVLELLDLSLLVLKQHFRPILFTSAIIGVPLLILDILALRWMLGEDAYLVADYLESPESAMHWRYIFHLVALYTLQFQIASLPVTIFLGNQIFFEHISMRQLLGKLKPLAWRAIVVLGVLRLGLVPLVAEFFVNRGLVFDWTVELWFIFMLSCVGLIFRAGWPFAPEILGLELCRVRARSDKEVSYGKRNRSLHKYLLADHYARFMAASTFAVLLTLMILGAGLFMQGTLRGDWQWNRWFDFITLPLALWLTGLFMAVFRFLSYLDSRIRLEGWELELRLRAESQRLLHPPGVRTATVAPPSTEPVAP